MSLEHPQLSFLLYREGEHVQCAGTTGRNVVLVQGGNKYHWGCVDGDQRESILWAIMSPGLADLLKDLPDDIHHLILADVFTAVAPKEPPVVRGGSPPIRTEREEHHVSKLVLRHRSPEQYTYLEGLLTTAQEQVIQLKEEVKKCQSSKRKAEEAAAGMMLENQHLQGLLDKQDVELRKEVNKWQSATVYHDDTKHPACSHPITQGSQPILVPASAFFVHQKKCSSAALGSSKVAVKALLWSCTGKRRSIDVQVQGTSLDSEYWTNNSAGGATVKDIVTTGGKFRVHQSYHRHGGRLLAISAKAKPHDVSEEISIQILGLLVESDMRPQLNNYNWACVESDGEYSGPVRVFMVAEDTHNCLHLKYPTGSAEL
ncbi:hypothetical protein C8R46DRAFT_1027688 [Mycena filopes]|nr:hypothetical protein C8R46DRAFT_1027688 [Mycena filopes]